MSDSSGITFILYRYDPSLPAAAVFVVLFALITVIHSVQLVHGRAWYFIPFVLGGICMLSVSSSLLE
jgi:hypothetical protein